ATSAAKLASSWRRRLAPWADFCFVATEVAAKRSRNATVILFIESSRAAAAAVVGAMPGDKVIMRGVRASRRGSCGRVRTGSSLRDLNHFFHFPSTEALG